MLGIPGNLSMWELLKSRRQDLYENWDYEILGVNEELISCWKGTVEQKCKKQKTIMRNFSSHQDYRYG